MKSKVEEVIKTAINISKKALKAYFLSFCIKLWICKSIVNFIAIKWIRHNLYDKLILLVESVFVTK